MGEICALASEAVAIADASRILHGSSSGDEAPWAEPIRQIAAALRSLDARVRALEVPGRGASGGGSCVDIEIKGGTEPEIRALVMRLFEEAAATATTEPAAPVAPAPTKKGKRR